MQKILIALLLFSFIGVTSCGHKRKCNTCPDWSYHDQDVSEDENKA